MSINEEIDEQLAEHDRFLKAQRELISKSHDPIVAALDQLSRSIYKAGESDEGVPVGETLCRIADTLERIADHFKPE